MTLFLDDRRVIRASPFNLSRGLARPFADLLKKIVRGRRARDPFIRALKKVDEVFSGYIEDERLGDANIVRDKLFILFPESEEEVCSIKKLREIEKNPQSEDGRHEKFSISVNPIIQEHRCERTGIKL